jgi:protein DGCR14
MSSVTVDDEEKQVAIRAQPGELAVDKEPSKYQRPKKIQMEEDDFTETMGKIIRRDFFPDLPKLEAQLEYINATDSNDPVKLREISERYAKEINATPSTSTYRTPLTSTTATPSQNKRPPEPDVPTSSSKIPRPEDSYTLDQFLSTHQSEDDASFNQIMDIEEEKRKQKYAWMYEREAIADAMNSSIPALTKGNEGGPLPLGGASETLALTDGSEQDKDGRGMIKLWKFTAKNTLMYMPEGAPLSASEIIKQKKDKVIKHVNTRLPREFVRKMATAAAAGSENAFVPQSTKEKVGIDGKKLTGEDSPRVNGYGFVATPLIRPGIDDTPVMTWGTIEGTPLHLDTDIVSTPGPTFKIPRVPERDLLAKRLADKASQSLKEKKKVALERTTSLLKSPLSKSQSNSERLKLLSPAARRLISTSPGLFQGTDKALRASYTPTRSPAPSKGTGLTPKPSTRGNQTPTVSAPSLTDNLLNLKNR